MNMYNMYNMYINIDIPKPFPFPFFLCFFCVVPFQPWVGGRGFPHSRGATQQPWITLRTEAAIRDGGGSNGRDRRDDLPHVASLPVPIIT